LAMHPLAQLLPYANEQHCLVRTRVCPSAMFGYLAPDLVGPESGTAGSREETLLRYLARVVDEEGDQGDDERYVEPGVGRSYLVESLNLSERPQFRDFSVTGVGLTPFSKDGFFLRGAHIDGRLPATRAHHRQRLAEALDQAGCRVPAVAAIITAPQLQHCWPDRTMGPAVLLVRGFRTVLRVKQLDPLANLMMSGPAFSRPIQELLRQECWVESGSLRTATSLPDSVSCTCLTPSFLLGTRPGRRCEDTSRCRRQRLEVMRGYSGRLLDHAAGRLGEELGRDPENEPMTRGEYLLWFANTMGAQLALMRRERFLHDYRMAQTTLNDPYHLLNSLMDTNVTLLAEFADLDTGVLLDRDLADQCDELGITRATLCALQTDFEEHHVVEVALARSVVETASLVADRTGVQRKSCVRVFSAAYDRGKHEP
jgi:hypothetical protein